MTTSLSSSGVYFETEQLLVPGQEVSLVFPFERVAPGGTRAACAARVLRVEKRQQRYGVAANYEAIKFEIP